MLDQNTMQKIDCHSMQCVSISVAGDAKAAPTICQKSVKGKGDVCPTQAEHDSGKHPTMSGAICTPNPKASTATTMCEDHLNPSCSVVLNPTMYNFSCTTDMGLFSPSLAGQKLSSYCPVSCHACTGESLRFCRDNPDWNDPNSNNCDAYKNDAILNTNCFNSEAYIACPSACGACM